MSSKSNWELTLLISFINKINWDMLKLSHIVLRRLYACFVVMDIFYQKWNEWNAHWSTCLNTIFLNFDVVVNTLRIIRIPPTSLPFLVQDVNLLYLFSNWVNDLCLEQQIEDNWHWDRIHELSLIVNIKNHVVSQIGEERKCFEKIRVQNGRK